ncbi:hypothetical protein ACIQZB_25245 [Streptomyces sp. NPDC097727]|uniref:hypothetical protein n=1 Tax=Streptomyces sp. NPDC097727 TaxID=3366092 RepID=UPI003813D48C
MGAGGGTHDPRPGGAGGVGPAYCNAGSGGGGTCTSGGTPGGNGSPGVGGNGGNFGSPSGAGGVGTGNDTGAGGGGGSSFAFVGATNVSTVANPTGTPAVTISYESVPTTTTTPSRTKLGVGTPVTDRATVTGDAPDSNPAASGATVSFFVCGPAATRCTNGGTAVSGPQPLRATSSTTATVTSPHFRPAVAVTYCWRAEYSGSPSCSAASADGSSEYFTATHRGGGPWHHDHN